MPPSAQAVDGYTVKIRGRNPGPFVDKTPLWATNMVGQASLQKVCH